LQQSHKIEQREEILRRHNRNASVTEALDELNEQELQQQEQLEQQQAAQPAELTSAASEEEPSHDRPKLTAFDSTVSNYSDQFSDSDHEEGELNEDGTPKLKRARTLRPTASANINDDEFEKVNYCPRCPSWSDWSINAIGKRRNALYNLFEHPQSSVTVRLYFSFVILYAVNYNFFCNDHI
jgi:hypothetical protein